MYDANSRDSRVKVRGPSEAGGCWQWDAAIGDDFVNALSTWLAAHASKMRHGLARRSHWPFVMRHVIYFINNKMLSATRRGGSRRQQKWNEQQLANWAKRDRCMLRLKDGVDCYCVCARAAPCPAVGRPVHWWGLLCEKEDKLRAHI